MLNSAGSASARLPAALETILRVRGLTAPDGRPLYAYKLTPTEIAGLKEPLAYVFSRVGGSCLDTKWCSRAFVAIACDWIRRWKEGGAWGYAPLCAELGARYGHDLHWQEVSSAIREGLSGWGRSVHLTDAGDHEYLASLVCEAGLPLRAVHDGRWLSRWPQSALDLAGRGIDPNQATQQEAWRAPKTFAEMLSPVAAGLVALLNDLKRGLPPPSERSGLDAVAWLDLNRNGWRDALPLDMGDDDARALIERVVRRADRGVPAELESGVGWCAGLMATGILRSP